MAPVLTHWKPCHSLIVETDASDYALAGILLLQDDDSEIRPIAFLSWTFSGAKLNYDVHDKELLAIYEAFRSWQHYLEGASSQIDVLLLLNYSPDDKPIGPNTSPPLIW